MSPFALGYDPDVSLWTLQQVFERGTLVFECLKCRHVSMMMEDRLLGRFRRSDTVSVPLKLARCRRCACKRVKPLVRLNMGRKDLAWWPMPPRLGR
jgi:hypothetical protein